MHRLAHLLDEEDEVAPKGCIGLCAEIRCEGADVATNQNATGTTFDILWMCGYLIAGHTSHQQVSHQCAVGIGSTGCEERTHGAVNAHYSGASKQAVQCGDVAETYQPFGMGSPFFERQPVYQLDGTISTTVANNCLDCGVVQCPADVAHAFFHSAGIFPCIHFAHIGANHGLQAPTAQHLGSLLHVLHWCVVRWGDEGNPVALL